MAATVQHIALEGRCYFINCDMVFHRADYPAGLHCPDEIARLNDIPCRGGSCIVDPYGHYVVQPVWDTEDILCANLDMQRVPAEPHGARRVRPLCAAGRAAPDRAGCMKGAAV